MMGDGLPGWDERAEARADLLHELGVAAKVLERAGAEATWIVFANGNPGFWGKPSQHQLKLGEQGKRLASLGDLVRDSMESYVAFMHRIMGDKPESEE